MARTTKKLAAAELAAAHEERVDAYRALQAKDPGAARAHALAMKRTMRAELLAAASEGDRDAQRRLDEGCSMCADVAWRDGLCVTCRALVVDARDEGPVRA
jgi:hypothetical protein